MLKKIESFIKENELVSTNKTIVVAVSGGIDSMVLLDCLRRLSYNLVCAHVNHQVRTESYEEAIFVKSVCDKFGIPFEKIELEISHDNNFHDTARAMRYKFFNDIANKYDGIIATAHHADDLIETVLMKLTRGSNIYGYAGISASVKQENLLIRPLLCVTREEIVEYAKENNIEYREDQSNNQDKYTRNRFRHHIVPLLKKENPSLADEVLAYSDQLYKAFNFIRKTSINHLKEWDSLINIEEYNKLDDIIKQDIINYLFEENNITNNAEKIKSCILLLESKMPNQRINIGKNAFFVKAYNKAFLEENKKIADYSFIVNEYKNYLLPNGDTLIVSENKQNSSDKYFKLCYNILKCPIVVRNRRDGDRINLPFGSKKLKDIFIDKKIDLETRNTVPIIIKDDEIIGAIGICSKNNTSDALTYITWQRRK